jgi:thioesterase domain-containing protein
VEHSTIESLAAMLSNRAVVRTPSPLVSLRTANSGRPLFLIHPGRGDVMMYGKLARLLPDRPIYGLQAIGLQAEGLPSMRISTMARRYLKEIFRVAPDGPYLLAGSCAGGLVAFEMARQLHRAGKPVGMVALLNSDFPRPRGNSFKRAQSTARDALRMWRWSLMRAAGLGRGERWLPAYRRFVQNMHTHARRFYRPIFYPGTITLFMTNEEPHPGGDLRLAMGAYAREARIFKFAGDRRMLFVPPNLDELVRHLHLCMEEVESAQFAKDATVSATSGRP